MEKLSFSLLGKFLKTEEQKGILDTIELRGEKDGISINDKPITHIDVSERGAEFHVVDGFYLITDENGTEELVEDIIERISQSGFSDHTIFPPIPSLVS